MKTVDNFDNRHDGLEENWKNKFVSINLDFFADKMLILSGWDNGPKMSSDRNYYQDANSVLFILDGVTYQAIEDPDDGYRSSLSEIFITDLKCNKFNPHIVNAKYRIEPFYRHDIIDFYDIITNKIVMSLGTNHEDSWYPCCEMYFDPKNLAINAEPVKYKIFMREKKLERVLKN